MVGSQGELSSAQSCGDKGPVFERLFLLVPSLCSLAPVGKCHRRASLAEMITASLGHYYGAFQFTEHSHMHLI